jgi:serine/threonine-protein kinase
MSNPIGQLIGGRWRLEATIGRGGHSVIYRARDLRGGPPVAVKVLHENVAGDPEYTVRMVREQRAMAALAGTAAVRVHGLTATPDGALCLVMELLVGKDLDDRLAEIEAAEQRMQVAELVRIMTPVIETLDAAHDAEIVHRDLKPGNIYVIDEARGGGVRLLDFGLAKIKRAQPLTREGFIIGSPSYIAPEVWLGDVSQLDHRVDVYSLGAIVFRALAGRVPFDAPTIRGKLEMATRAERPSLHQLRPDLPLQVDQWVRQVLSIDPERRFHRVRGMWNALLATLEPCQLA